MESYRPVSRREAGQVGQAGLNLMQQGAGVARKEKGNVETGREPGLANATARSVNRIG